MQDTAADPTATSAWAGHPGWRPRPGSTSQRTSQKGRPLAAWHASSAGTHGLSRGGRAGWAATGDGAVTPTLTSGPLGESVGQSQPGCGGRRAASLPALPAVCTVALSPPAVLTQPLPGEAQPPSGWIRPSARGGSAAARSLSCPLYKHGQCVPGLCTGLPGLRERPRSAQEGRAQLGQRQSQQQHPLGPRTGPSPGSCCRPRPWLTPASRPPPPPAPLTLTPNVHDPSPVREPLLCTGLHLQAAVVLSHQHRPAAAVGGPCAGSGSSACPAETASQPHSAAATETQARGAGPGEFTARLS